MRLTPLARNAFLGVSLFCLGLPEAEAIEIFAPPDLAAHMDDGMITQVRGGRGGGGMRHHGGGRSGMHRGGMHHRPGGAHRPPGGARQRQPQRQPQHQQKRQSQRQSQRQSKRQPEHQPQREPQYQPRRRGDGLDQRGGGRVLGRRGSGSGSLLVLYRPQPPGGLLGRVPLSARLLGHRDVGPPRARADPLYDT
jgi:hypothetical protein